MMKNQLQTVFSQAAYAAIKEVGLATFLSTSLFASNHAAADVKKAA